MNVQKLRAHLFGSLIEEINKLGDVCLDAEAYANAIYDLFVASSQEDSPAADLFRREKWDDLQSLLYPDRPVSAVFTGTCLRRALARYHDPREVVGRILGVLNNDFNGEVMTKAVTLHEAGSWDELVANLAPQLNSADASTVAWQLKRIAVDPDGLIEAIDADGAAGKITPRDAVDRMCDVYYGTSFLETAVEDLVKKLLPTVPPEFRTAAATHLTNQLRPKRVVIEVTDAPVRAPEPMAPAPAPITEEQIAQQAYEAALADVVQLAKIIEPLTKAGLTSSDALEVANTAVGEAKLKLNQKLVAANNADAGPLVRPAPYVSGLARNYGATILDVD